jgi:Lon-like ATP-dependent protease
LRIIQDLGEDAFPERTATQNERNDDSSKTVEQMKPEAATSDSSSPKSEEEVKVTTEQRKALDVPDTVHVRITPENLKDYVGPQVYQKDRMYVHAPPHGVSTGLGYLGNGSGAVMPVEAMVSPAPPSDRLTH